MIVISLSIFLLGASIASFLNATIYRIEKGMNISSLAKRRSHCEKCKKELTWLELFPILGYVIIKGKCANCQSKINIYYPLSEFFLGSAFLFFALYQVAWYYWVILLFLFVLSYYDNKDRSIPRDIVHILLLFSVVVFVFFNLNWISALVALSVITVIFLLTLIIKKSFGAGDFFILFSMGLVLDYKLFTVFFWLSILSGLLYSVVFTAYRKKKLRGFKVAMLPFFTLSFLFSVIYGEKIFEVIVNKIISSFY